MTENETEYGIAVFFHGEPVITVSLIDNDETRTEVWFTHIAFETAKIIGETIALLRCPNCNEDKVRRAIDRYIIELYLAWDDVEEFFE